MNLWAVFLDHPNSVLFDKIIKNSWLEFCPILTENTLDHKGRNFNRTLCKGVGNYDTPPWENTLMTRRLEDDEKKLITRNRYRILKRQNYQFKGGDFRL